MLPSHRIIGRLILGLCLVFGANLQAQDHPFKEKMQRGQPTLSVAVPGPLTIIRPDKNAHHPPTPFAPMALRQPKALPSDVDKVVYGRESGLPIYIEAKSPQLAFKSSGSQVVEEALAYQFLEDHKDFLSMEDPLNNFKVSRIDERERASRGMVHVRMVQEHKGIPIHGSEIILHFYPQQRMVFAGRYQPQPRIDEVIPGLSPDAAADLAMADVAHHEEVLELSDFWKAKLDYEKPETELVIYPLQGSVLRHRLAYHVTLRPNVLGRWEYWIDAQNGEVLNHYDHTCSLGPATGSSNDLGGVNQNLNLWNDNGTYYLIDTDVPMYTGPSTGNDLPPDGSGFILTGDLNNTSIDAPSYFYVTSSNPNSWAPVAVSAHDNARVSYDYFLTTFQRNSINGSGGDIVSFVNVADENGGGLDNAFWNGVAMFYGNGNTAFLPLAGAQDVGGHEMSHGVVQETAGLEYQGQSGALNESFADIFGVMIDRDDWRLGEDVVRTGSFPSGALRDMQNPNQGGTGLGSPGWQPDHMDDLYTGTQNNGGVHINSGIVNRAFFLFATSTSKDIAEQVYYRALDLYLTRSSQFIDSRFAVIRAAEDLHGGAGNNVALAAAAAFDAVGITDPNGGTGSDGGNDYENDVEVNPGSQFIISNDINPQDNNTWYNSDTLATSFAAYTTTSPQTRISVRDDGLFGYFVGEDKHIYELALDPNFTGNRESRISNNPEWDNVAVSKDGLRLAAVSTEIDTSIYVFDFSGSQVQGYQFKLYNPTTAQSGANTGGVLYADAISWDFSGNFIMYDAFNRIPNSQGTDLEYWDVGFLRAWDSETNGPGDGNISKLFTNLPEGVSVGNAEFSSNSPHIIAFDYIEQDNFSTRLSVLGANIEAGMVGTLYDNAPVLGYPNFSTNDTKVIINDEGLVQGSTTGVLSEIELAGDKINANPGQSPVPFIGFVRFATWYAIGSRVITQNEETLVEKVRLNIYPNPAQNRLHLDLGNLEGEISLEVRNLLGQEMEKRRTRILGGELLTLDVSAWPPGTYVLQVSSDAGRVNQKFIKE